MGNTELREIPNVPELVDEYLADRQKRYRPLPASREALLASRMWGLFVGTRLVGGFTLYETDASPCYRLLPTELAQSHVQDSETKGGPCEIGAVWLSNPTRDSALSIQFWRCLLIKMHALGYERYLFGYDCESVKLKKLYRYAFPKRLHTKVIVDANGLRLNLGIYEVPLRNMRLNLALYILRRTMRSRWIAGWRTLTRSLAGPRRDFAYRLSIVSQPRINRHHTPLGARQMQQREHTN